LQSALAIESGAQTQGTVGESVWTDDPRQFSVAAKAEHQVVLFVDQ
jgi:hypothetical protein